MVDVQTIGVLVTAASVSVAAVYYMMTLKAQQANMKANLETRQAQLFRDFLKTQESYEFTKIMAELLFTWQWSDFEDYMSRYGTKNPDEMSKFVMFFTHWEGLAVMVRRGLMSVELIYELNYNAVIGVWERYAPVVAGMRRLGNSLQLYEPVEWLYGEMKRLQAVKGHSYTLPR